MLSPKSHAWRDDDRADTVGPMTADKDSTSTHLLRAPNDVIEALDAWVARLNKTSHARWSRNALLLAIIDRALKERADGGGSP